MIEDIVMFKGKSGFFSKGESKQDEKEYLSLNIFNELKKILPSLTEISAGSAEAKQLMSKLEFALETQFDWYREDAAENSRTLSDDLMSEDRVFSARLSKLTKDKILSYFLEFTQDYQNFPYDLLEFWENVKLGLMRKSVDEKGHYFSIFVRGLGKWAENTLKSPLNNPILERMGQFALRQQKKLDVAKHEAEKYIQTRLESEEGSEAISADAPRTNVREFVKNFIDAYLDEYAKCTFKRSSMIGLLATPNYLDFKTIKTYCEAKPNSRSGKLFFEMKRKEFDDGTFCTETNWDRFVRLYKVECAKSAAVDVTSPMYRLVIDDGDARRSWAEVRKYAKQNPDSRTAEIVKAITEASAAASIRLYVS